MTIRTEWGAGLMWQPPIVKELGRNHDYARVIQVIETTNLRRGLGKDSSDPIRMVVQYWTLEGELLAEVDPHKLDK